MGSSVCVWRAGKGALVTWHTRRIKAGQWSQDSRPGASRNVDAGQERTSKIEAGGSVVGFCIADRVGIWVRPEVRNSLLVLLGLLGKLLWLSSLRSTLAPTESLVFVLWCSPRFQPGVSAPTWSPLHHGMSAWPGLVLHFLESWAPVSVLSLESR